MPQTLIATFDAYVYFVLPEGVMLNKEGAYYSPDTPGWWYIRNKELIYRDAKGNVKTIQACDEMIESSGKPNFVEFTD